MPSSFWGPEISAGVLGTVYAAIIMAAVAVLYRQWKSIYRCLKARRIKKYKGLSFGVLVCDFQGDKSGNISRLVRNDLTSLNFESQQNWKPFKVEHFPLSLSSLNDGAERVSLEKAKRWLRKTEYDVIIWGEYIEETKQTVVKVMGAHSGATHPVEVRALVNPKQFSEIMAEAVGRDVVELAWRAYSEPSKVPVTVLREISKKIERLLASDMSWFSIEEAKRVRFAINNLETQICSQSASFEDWRRAEMNARHLVALFDRDIDRGEWIDAVHDYSKHALRKASVGLDTQLLRDAVGLMETAAKNIQPAAGQASKAKYLLACRKWLSAYQDRDTCGTYQAQSFDIAFKEFQQATTEEGKGLLFVYVASIYPEQFSQKVGLGIIKRGWFQKMWDYTVSMQVDDYLGGLVFFELADAVARSENASVRHRVAEDAFLHIKNLMSVQSNKGSFVFKQMRLSYILLANRLMDAAGLTVFVDHLATPDIVRVLNLHSEDIYAELTSGKNERDYYNIRAERLALLKVTLASVTNELIYYRQAEDLFASFSNELEKFNSERKKDVINQRCSALNNWGVKARDISLLDRSYRILMLHGFPSGYMHYLIAYIHYAKANILKANAFGNETDAMKLSYRDLMQSALQQCESAKQLGLSNHEERANSELSQTVRSLLDLNRSALPRRTS